MGSVARAQFRWTPWSGVALSRAGRVVQVRHEQIDQLGHADAEHTGLGELFMQHMNNSPRAAARAWLAKRRLAPPIEAVRGRAVASCAHGAARRSKRTAPDAEPMSSSRVAGA